MRCNVAHPGLAAGVLIGQLCWLDHDGLKYLKAASWLQWAPFHVDAAGKCVAASQGTHTPDRPCIQSTSHQASRIVFIRCYACTDCQWQGVRYLVLLQP